jgi:hypothetical protein
MNSISNLNSISNQSTCIKSPRSRPISSHCKVRSLFPFHFHISSKLRQVCKVLKSGMGSFLEGNRTLSKKVIGVTSLVHLIYTRSISMQCSKHPLASSSPLMRTAYRHALCLHFRLHALHVLRHNIPYASPFLTDSSSVADGKLQAWLNNPHKTLLGFDEEVCHVYLICSIV